MKYILLLFTCLPLCADTATNLVVVNSSTNDVSIVATGGVYFTGGNGDVNGDGKLTAYDVALVRAWLLTGTNLTSAQYSKADVNGDGLVNTLDVDLIKKAILTLIRKDMMSGYGKWLVSRRSRTEIPVNSTFDGEPGQTAWDANYVYICVASNTWKRAKLESW